MYGNIFTNSMSKINLTSVDDTGRKMVKTTRTRLGGQVRGPRLDYVA
jgi:hypothetical protein